MIVSTDTQNKEDVKNTVKVLNQILKMDLTVSTKEDLRKPLKEDLRKPLKEEKPKKKKKEPEPDLEIEDDEDIFDDDDSEEKEESIKEYTEADIKKALTAYANENDQKAAKKILKQYSATGKLADVDSDDYANLIADLV